MNHIPYVCAVPVSTGSGGSSTTSSWVKSLNGVFESHIILCVQTPDSRTSLAGVMISSAFLFETEDDSAWESVVAFWASALLAGGFEGSNSLLLSINGISSSSALGPYRIWDSQSERRTRSNDLSDRGRLTGALPRDVLSSSALRRSSSTVLDVTTFSTRLVSTSRSVSPTTILRKSFGTRCTREGIISTRKRSRYWKSSS